MRNSDRVQLEVRAQDAAAADLVKIVVLAVHPENWDRGDVVVSTDPPREPDGRERLEQRKQRTTKETRLLPRDDRHRFGVCQLLGRDHCGGRGSPRRELGGHHCGDLRMCRWVVHSGPDGVSPYRGIGW